MKFFLSLLIVVVAFSSCEFKVNTGKKKIQNGFSYDKVIISHYGEFPIEDEKINLGESVDIKFTGIQNATKKDGYIHLGIRFEIKNEAGEVLEQSEDVLSNIEQMDPDLNQVNVFFPVRYADSGEKLFVTATLFDKYGTGSYPIKKTFTVVNAHSPSTKKVLMDHNFKFQPVVHCFQESDYIKQAPLPIEKGKRVNIYVHDFFEAPLNGFFKCNYRMLITDLGNDQIITDLTDEIQADESELKGIPLNFTYTPNSPGKHLVEIFYENENQEKFHLQTHVNIK